MIKVILRGGQFDGHIIDVKEPFTVIPSSNPAIRHVYPTVPIDPLKKSPLSQTYRSTGEYTDDGMLIMEARHD